VKAEELIRRNILRGARHLRFLALSEGALGLALFVGWYLFLEIVLDHIISLSAVARVGLLILLAASTAVIVIGAVALPIIRTVNRLYIAQRVEFAFPDFKNSLVTYVQLEQDGGDEGVMRLVAHHAARHFEGVNVAAVLDSTRFVRLGYSFVALVLLVFVYSIVVPKSMFTSFLRSIYPWEAIAAPTRTHIRDVSPGDARIPQGADLAISAVVSGAKDATIKWSRDKELWQAIPMTTEAGRWQGLLSHVDADMYYYVAAGDATSPVYGVATLLPPVVESVGIDLAYPSYTALSPRHVDDGNIQAPVDTTVSIAIRSNKTLQSVSLALPGDGTADLQVNDKIATGKFKVTQSGRYSVLLTDSDGLKPNRPVQYDIVASPDLAPRVSIDGPKGGAEVGLDDEVPFQMDAADDYGLTKLVFHFETNAGNADVKNFRLPEGKREFSQMVALVPRLLGAIPGDMVTYYLEAQDNHDGKPNSAQTPAYSFKIADSAATKPLAAFEKPSGTEVKTTESTLPGKKEDASGQPKTRENAPSKQLASANKPGGQPQEAAKDSFLKMLKDDKPYWDKITKHLNAAPKDASGPSQAASGTPVTPPQAPQNNPQQQQPNPPDQAPPSNQQSAQQQQGQSAQNAPQAQNNQQPDQQQSQPQQNTPPPQDNQNPNGSGEQNQGAQSSQPQQQQSQAGGSSQTQTQGDSENASKSGQPKPIPGQPGDNSAQPQQAQQPNGEPAPAEDGQQAQSQGQSGQPSQSPDGGQADSGEQGKSSGQPSAPDQNNSTPQDNGDQTNQDGNKEGQQDAQGNPSDNKSADSKSDSVNSGQEQSDAEGGKQGESTSSQKPAATPDAGTASGDTQQKDSQSQSGQSQDNAPKGPSEPGDASDKAKAESGEAAADKSSESGQNKSAEQKGQADTSGQKQQEGDKSAEAGSSDKLTQGEKAGAGAPQGAQPKAGESAEASGGKQTGDKPGGADDSSKGQSGTSDGRETAPAPGARGKDAGKPDNGLTGGDTSGPKGSRAEVPEVGLKGDKPPLTQTGAAPLTGTDAQIATTKKIVDKLANDARANVTDPSLLADLGWKPGELATFVRKYENALKDVEAKPYEGPIELEGKLDSGEVVAGERTAESIGSVDTGNAAVTKDQIQGLKDVPREDVSPEYRKLLDEYYRSLGQTQ